MLWNDRFTKGLPSLEIPDPFFIRTYEQHITQTGKALDLAAGIGRHTLYLAQRGWQVRAVDISDVAMKQLAAAAEGMNVEIISRDLSNYNIDGVYDLIVLFYYFDRSLFPKIIQALKPGGMLIAKLATGKINKPDALQEQELKQLTQPLQQVYYAERPVKDRGVAEYSGIRQ